MMLVAGLLLGFVGGAAFVRWRSRMPQTRRALAADAIISGPRRTFVDDCLRCGARYRYTLADTVDDLGVADSICPVCGDTRIHIASNAEG
jgi:hypothetical protein